MVRAWSQAKRGVMIKAFYDQKSKMEPSVDRPAPTTIMLPAVPNRRLHEISARQGFSADNGGQLINWKRAMYRDCKLLQG